MRYAIAAKNTHVSARNHLLSIFQPASITLKITRHFDTQGEKPGRVFRRIAIHTPFAISLANTAQQAPADCI
jgi:hypothetical protein